MDSGVRVGWKVSVGKNAGKCVEGRPAMVYSLKTVQVRGRREAELEVKEIKMFSSGITIDIIKNERDVLDLKPENPVCF